MARAAEQQHIEPSAISKRIAQLEAEPGTPSSCEHGVAWSAPPRVHPRHPSAARSTMLNQAAARLGRKVSYRVIVSNCDSAFRVVAANLGISVIPVEAGGSFSSTMGVRFIPLTDAWAPRQFVICFQRFDALQPAAQLLATNPSR